MTPRRGVLHVGGVDLLVILYHFLRYADLF